MIIKVKRPNGQIIEAANVGSVDEYSIELAILMEKYEGCGYIFEMDLQYEDTEEV